MASNEPLFGFNTTQKKTLIDFVGEVASTPEQVAAVATLTQTTGAPGGTVNGAMETTPAAASAAVGASTDTLATTVSVNNALTAIRNNIAELNTKVNQIIQALQA